MNRLSKISLAAFTIALLSSPQAHADTATIRTSDNMMEFDLGAMNYKYGETANGTTFDTENGWNPSMKLSFGFLGSDKQMWSILSNFYFDMSLQATFGNTDYAGGLQNLGTGQVTPLNSYTHDTMVDFSTKLGRAYTIGSQWMAIPFGDIGMHYWHRHLTGEGGYVEEYTNGELQAGGRIQYSPFSQWVFGLMGEAGTTFSSSMSTGGVKYNLGSTTVYTFEGKVAYELTKSIELTTTFDFKGFGFGKSPVVSGAYEPDSYTHETTAMLGIGYHM